MMLRCSVCSVESDVPAGNDVAATDPPDFDTRPGEPLRSTIHYWVMRCPACGYCAADISVAHPKAAEIVRSEAYQEKMLDASIPSKAREFLGYAYLLDRLREHADAGWTALQGAWVCDDAGDNAAATHCREQAIEYWKRGKHLGQAFSEDLASEYALVADLHRRMGQYELAMVTCSEALDIEDLPPVIEQVLRRQKSLIEQRDTGAHSIRELLTPLAPAN